MTAIFDTFLRTNVAYEGGAYLTFVGGVPYATNQLANNPRLDQVRLDQDPELVARWSTLTLSGQARAVR